MKRALLVMVAVISVAALLGSCSKKADTSSGGPAESAWTVLTPQQLNAMMSSKDIYLVNVHVPYEGEIPGTDASIPFTEIASRLQELPFGEKQVVIYCRSGNMSTEAAQEMVQAGAPPFFELGGGFYAWQDAGYQLKGA